jgi:hypothetical protein
MPAIGARTVLVFGFLRNAKHPVQSAAFQLLRHAGMSYLFADP